jgi:valyl-tRNA synthetase
MNEEAGDLAGLEEEADERILAWLKEHGHREAGVVSPPVALCDRCKTRIEPRISPSGGARWTG